MPPSKNKGKYNTDWTHLTNEERRAWAQLFFEIRSVIAICFFIVAIVLACISSYAQNPATPTMASLQIFVCIVLLCADACHPAHHSNLVSPVHEEVDYDSLKTKWAVLTIVFTVDVLSFALMGIQFGAPGNCVGREANWLLLAATCIVLVFDVLHAGFRAGPTKELIKELGWGKNGDPRTRGVGGSGGGGGGSGSSGVTTPAAGAGGGAGMSSSFRGGNGNAVVNRAGYIPIDRTPPRPSPPPAAGRTVAKSSFYS